MGNEMRMVHTADLYLMSFIKFIGPLWWQKRDAMLQCTFKGDAILVVHTYPSLQYEDETSVLGPFPFDYDCNDILLQQCSRWLSPFMNGLWIG